MRYREHVKLTADGFWGPRDASRVNQDVSPDHTSTRGYILLFFFSRQYLFILIIFLNLFYPYACANEVSPRGHFQSR